MNLSVIQGNTEPEKIYDYIRVTKQKLPMLNGIKNNANEFANLLRHVFVMQSQKFEEQTPEIQRSIIHYAQFCKKNSREYRFKKQLHLQFIHSKKQLKKYMNTIGANIEDHFENVWNTCKKKIAQILAMIDNNNKTWKSFWDQKPDFQSPSIIKPNHLNTNQPQAFSSDYQ